MYEQITFPRISQRPFFYSNFVVTVDGKVQIEVDGATPYWPIGSKLDFETLFNLRAHADMLIHGKDTALMWRTIDGLYTKEFREKRKACGKEKDLAYAVFSNHPGENLVPQLSHSQGAKPILVTNTQAQVPDTLRSHVMVMQFGKDSTDLKAFGDEIHRMGYQNILVEGGPGLLGSFLGAGMLDEMFVTITPKIIGNREKVALTMVEGHLFPPDQVKHLELLSFENHDSELYLRYRIK